MRIYFDNAATTPLLPQVWEKMSEVLKNDFGNPSSIHHYGRVSRSIIEDARKKVARTIGASIGEIFFTSSATEANNTILHRSAIDLGISRFISSPTEHHCVLHTLQHIQKENPKIEVIWLQVDNHGCIDPAELESHLSADPNKTMVSLMYGNNEIGTIHDIATIGSICKKHNAYLHCDAVQMIGKYEVDVQALGVSFLSGTAHKFHGPKGSGFFYMKSDNIIQPYIYGGAQERNMRAGTENVAGIAGLAEALTLAMGEMTHRRSHISGLKQRFEEQLLNEVEGILFNHPTGDQCMYHLSSVSFPESSMAEMLMFNLDIEGIAASSGSACSAGIAEDSHVLQAIGHPQGRKTVRFSFSSLNTEEEVDATVAKIKKTDDSKMNHELYMQRCVDLALKGGLDTKSNPMVGAVLVYKDKIIGEGWHSFYGGPHAEVNAISSVKSEDQELIPLSTLYVSLEPCCVQGKTPACTSLILENKIPKVVIGSMDPDPRMQGKGLTLLREQGIEVTEKVLQHECDALLSRFKANLKKHPYIVLKWATSFDQVMGHRQERLIITGEAALWHTHKWRSECHGILIGKETAKTDNPLLNTRYYPGPSPIKIVMDRNLELDPQLRLFAEGEVIVVNEKKQETSGRVKYVKVNSTYHWPEVMEKLYENQIYSVLVEGGSKILNSLIASGWWNEARILRTQALLKNQLETQDWITAPDIAGKLIKQIDIEDGCKAIYIENKVQG